VQSVEQACQTLTSEEVGRAAGRELRLVFDDPWEDVLRDVETGAALTPEPGVGRRCTFAERVEQGQPRGFMVALYVHLDPTAAWYESNPDRVTPTLVPDLGDEARDQSVGSVLSIHVRWGVWTVRSLAGDLQQLDAPNPVSSDDLAEILRIMVPRLPRQ
jgi:hypothetical protein